MKKRSNFFLDSYSSHIINPTVYILVCFTDLGVALRDTAAVTKSSQTKGPNKNQFTFHRFRHGDKTLNKTDPIALK
jgi:hypothetical protein